MKCPECAFMIGYEKADGMLCIFKGDEIWVGLCRRCNSLMTLSQIKYTHGDIAKAIKQYYERLETTSKKYKAKEKKK